MNHAQALETIEQVISQLRPAIQGHAGDIELIKYEKNIVYVRLHGACVNCPISMYTLKLGIEESLKNVVPEIKEVIALD